MLKGQSKIILCSTRGGYIVHFDKGTLIDFLSIITPYYRSTERIPNWPADSTPNVPRADSLHTGCGMECGTSVEA